MKRSMTLVVIIVGVMQSLWAEKLNLGDPNLVERFGMQIVKEKIDLYDVDALGLWVLKNDYRSKYQKVRNDEFELDDAKKWAFDKFKQKLSRIKPIDKDAEFHLYLSGVEFGKYDFRGKKFPLLNALEEGTYMRYGGRGKIVERWRGAKLVFENATSEINYLPMEKEEAKKFVRSRKDKYGNIDRNLAAHYVYTITSYEETDEFRPNEQVMRIKFTGRLKSVDFMDKKQKYVLKHFEFLPNRNPDMNNSNTGGK